MNINGFINSIQIMIYGMGGIFIVTSVIYMSIVSVNKICQKADNQ